MDRERALALDRDRPAQAINRQALDEIIRRFGFAIDEEVVAIGPDDEVEQAFALRGQQPAQTGSAPATSLVTSPWRKPPTSSPARRTRTRSVRVVADMSFS